MASSSEPERLPCSSQPPIRTLQVLRLPLDEAVHDFPAVTLQLLAKTQGIVRPNVVVMMGFLDDPLPLAALVEPRRIGGSRNGAKVGAQFGIDLDPQLRECSHRDGGRDQ